jgi:long-chain acyl-CoA synthetase
MEFRDFRNVHEMLKETVDRFGDRTAYRSILDSGEMTPITWNEFYDEVRRAGKSLIALGVGKDDKANILSYTNYRWVLTDLAMATIGSCAVGIYHSLLAKDIAHIVNHSDAVLIFAEDEGQLATLVEIRAEIPEVRKVILFSGTAPADDWVITYEEFLELGARVPDKVLDGRIANVEPEDVATIVYTSGTTGVPKGAVLTHDNITFTAQSVWGSVDSKDDDETLLFLPLAHVFARTLVFTALVAGATTTFARSMNTIAEDFKIVRPHWFPSVPRVYEKVHSKIISGAQGRVRWCISGAAPINPDIARFFHAAGVLIVEGIGMTENTSFTNLNRYDNYRFGWVGPTGPGIEQKTEDDGEILYRGRNVMREYYKMPAETAETLTSDGWQHTGDLGEIDDEGFLKITGRKKDLIVTAGGKNVAPSAIEGLIATSKYISQVCVIGDRQKYLTALITIDADNVTAFAEEKGIATDNLDVLLSNQEINDLIESVVEEKNAELAPFETIKGFRLLPEFSIENGLLTPTLKVKRNIAMERFADVIEEMYREN